jgi:hypothetical protein
MDPLRLVEERVGAVKSGPTYIILHVFVDETNARTVKNVAACMHGNEVLVEHAVNCFNACDGLNRNQGKDSARTQGNRRRTQAGKPKVAL